MKAIAVVNNKGGVGKTTTSINIAAALAAMEKKVILFDNDPQANVTTTFARHYNGPTLANAYIAKNTEVPIINLSLEEFSFDLVPSSYDLEEAVLRISATADKSIRLRGILSKIESLYDYCIIDCPPNLGTLTENALIACTGFIVCVQAGSEWAVNGVEETLKKVKNEVADWLNPNIILYGTLINFYDKRAKINILMLDELNHILTHYGYPNKIFEQKIHSRKVIQEAVAMGQDIFSYLLTTNTQSPSADEYFNLAAEIDETIGFTAIKEK